MSTRKSQVFFSLKCLVKPHRIGYVSSSQGCCSPFPTANHLQAVTCSLVLGSSCLLFSVDFSLLKIEKVLLYHTVIQPYLSQFI